jgi:sodium-dependent phosphate cotransporter|tara:strand:- start:2689 stop:3747 length:1059 start_codon:yes stop_codon:yes gene_type:complete
MKKWLKLTFFIYLFILSIELIKKSSLLLAPDIKNLLIQNITPLKAISVGWFTTSVVQSSGAVGSITAAFTGNDIINLTTAVYILIGASLGTTITAMIISLITVTYKRRDFRHGFEIALSYSIFSALLAVIVFFLEFFFSIFSKISLFLATALENKTFLLEIPDIIGIITNPLINIVPIENQKFLALAFGFILLITVLRYIGHSVMDVLGGEKKARKFINKHFESKYKAYFIGVVLTAIVFSSSITIGLLVPLATARLISLRKAIPFILGANLGTFTDTFLAALIIGKTAAIATAFAYALLGVLGTIIFLPNINFLHKITKYTSKKLIKISRKKALYILIAFILIPLLIILIF